MEMRRALITGGTGMAGSHLIEYILANFPDYEVHVIKRWRCDMTNITREVYPKLILHECDLRDATCVFTVINKIRPDKIFHLAAQSFVQASWHYPHETINTNVQSQLNIFEAVRRIKETNPSFSPVIQVAGSSEEYGLVHPDECPMKETQPLRPLSPYAISKIGQDFMAYQYHQSYNLKTVRTRAFNHEGPRRGHIFVTSNFALQAAMIEAGLKPPTIYVGNLHSKRDYTDVRDTVRAYWLATEKCTYGEVYNICSGRVYSMQEVLDMVLKMATVPINVEVDPSRLRPSDVPLLHGDNTKFCTQTGWVPEIPFEKTMEDTLNYWREKLKEGTWIKGV